MHTRKYILVSSIMHIRASCLKFHVSCLMIAYLKSFCFHSCFSCYLALGEVEGASQNFKRCLQSGTDICVDRKIAVEASDGLQKAQV